VITARTTTVDDTRALAGAVADLVQAGDIVLLAGELGAGKTAFVQGFGRALGVTDRITSPTFTIAQEYSGRLRLHHLDVYRLDHLSETLDIGLPEIVDEGAVVVIEWGDVVVPALPADFCEIRLAFGEGDDDRIIELRPVGRRWSARARALAEGLTPLGEH
jgi:tRNA threonylcarbamoyladenosine biosynthesis protein TsaE